MEEDKYRKPMGKGRKPSLKEEDNLDILSGWEALEKRLHKMERNPLFRIKNALDKMQNQQLYQSASSLGAGILGLGLGILVSRWLGAWTPFLIAAGLFIHGWGMYKLHYRGSASWSKGS